MAHAFQEIYEMSKHVIAGQQDEVGFESVDRAHHAPEEVLRPRIAVVEIGDLYQASAAPGYRKRREWDLVARHFHPARLDDQGIDHQSGREHAGRSEKER